MCAKAMRNRGKPTRSHRRFYSQAAASTYSPMGTMRLVSSARRMHRADDTSHACGGPPENERLDAAGPAALEFDLG